MSQGRLNKSIGGNDRQACAQAEKIAKEHLRNRHWLLFFENNTVGVVKALHGGVRLAMGERLDIEKNDKIDIRLPEKNPLTSSNVWNAIVLAIGTKDYCHSEAMNVSFQVQQAAGDPNFQPMVDIPDPDLSVHEAVNQILLKGNSAESARRSVERGSSQQREGALISEEMGSADQGPMFQDVASESFTGNSDHSYTVLTPADVSRTLSEIEAGRGDNLLNTSGLLDANAVSVT